MIAKVDFSGPDEESLEGFKMQDEISLSMHSKKRRDLRGVRREAQRVMGAVTQGDTE